MSTRLYIGGLSPQITEQYLQEQLSAYGEVRSLKIFREPESKTTHTFALVEMSSAQAASDICAGLNNHPEKTAQWHVVNLKPEHLKSFPPEILGHFQTSVPDR